MHITILSQVPDDNGVSMQLLLGCIGAVNAVVLSPVLLIMVTTIDRKVVLYSESQIDCCVLLL